MYDCSAQCTRCFIKDSLFDVLLYFSKSWIVFKKLSSLVYFPLLLKRLRIHKIFFEKQLFNIKSEQNRVDNMVFS